MKKYLLPLSLLWVLVSCSGESQQETPQIRSFYAKGGDVSWITEMEDKGFKFYNAGEQEKECTALLKECGFNAARYRVWVDPSDGYCAKEDVLEKALRAQKLGMRIMIDFHYSDTWADPGKQYKPARWEDLDTDKLAEAVAEHTEEVLTYLKDHQVTVSWVQIGNEVTSGMLWENCKVQGQEASGFVRCFNSGAAAARKIFPEVKIILHTDNAWNMTTLQWFYDLTGAAGAQYDIIGLSLYPSYWDEAAGQYPDWRTKTGQAITNFAKLHERYGKPVMLVEFGMPASLPNESAACLTRLMEATSGYDWFWGIFLWEPESEHSRNGYDYGAFNSGKPTKAIEPFNN